MDAAVFAILSNIVDRMEAIGVTRDLVCFGVDENFINDIYEETGHKYSIYELHKAANKCLAHDWIEKRATIENQRPNLVITEKGIEIVQAKHGEEIDKKSRKFLKMVSDYIEDHKGLFLLFGFVVALATLIIKAIK